MRNLSILVILFSFTFQVSGRVLLDLENLSTVKTNYIISDQSSACDCNPEMKFLIKDCIKQNTPTQIGYYIYSKPIAATQGVKWVKVYQDGILLLEKEVTFNSQGFFSDALNVSLNKDTKFFMEFHCDKDVCFTSLSQNIRTIPLYEIQTKDISCYGKIDGQTMIMPESIKDIDLVWESGDRKNLVTNMHFGDYNVTIENVNGCKESKHIKITEPKPLHLNPKYISLQDNGQTSHFIKLEVTGGQPEYLYDWDHNGFGQMNDPSHIICTEEATHQVIVMDDNGCTIEDVISFQSGPPSIWQVNNTELLPERVIEDNKFSYDLKKALDLKHGDIDGDGLDGTVFDVEFFKDEVKILNPTTYESQPETEITAEIADEFGTSKKSTILLSNGFFILQNNSSTACNYFDPIVIDAVTSIGNPLPAGGTFKALERTSLIDYSTEVLDFDSATNTWTWDPGFVPPISVSNLAYILYYINGTDTLQSQLNVSSTPGSVDILGTSVCGNNGLVEILCSPVDGILTGNGILSSSYQDPSSDQIIYFIDPKTLPVNNTYTYTYTIPGSTGTMANLRCAAVVTDDLTVLPFPSVEINQIDSQVCEKEEIRLGSTASPTSGNLNSVTYEWFFRINNVTTPIQNSNINALIIPEATQTGQYIVRATQSNGCFAQDTGLVEVFELPKINSRVLTSTNCFGVSNAVVDVVIEGVANLSGYTFEWVGKETDTIRSGNFQSNLPADSFFITVTTPPLNSSGLMCSIIDTVVIESYPPISIECFPAKETLDCHDQRIPRTIIVNTPGTYQYRLGVNGQWQNSNTFTNLGIDDPLMTSQEFEVFVRNDIGCMASCKFTLIQPEKLTCTLTKTDLTCYQNGSGSITANIEGGTAPFRYMWSTGFNEGPTLFTTSAIGSLSAGTYLLTVTDANNCTSICSVMINQPALISPNLPPVNVCLDFDTQIIAAPTGGTGNYTFLWSLVDPGTTMAVNTNLIGTINDAVQDFTTWCLKPGMASLRVEVRDQNNCLAIDTTTVNMQSCFDLAIRKRVALPDKQYYPGDTVTFNIEVFNQGTVNAVDIRISDILDVNMEYDSIHNRPAQTGNMNAWIVGTNDSLHTIIPRINAGQKAILKVILSIKVNTDKQYMINTVRITGDRSEVPYGATFRLKDNPVDEDEILPPFNTPPTKKPEKDDEICDSMNATLFPVECPLGDDPDDEDGEDYAMVSICQLKGRNYIDNQCVSEESRILGLSINTPYVKDQMDPTGNGDGIENGDTGNNLASFHHTFIDAVKDTLPITGRIIFLNGNGGINSSNGFVTPQGDLRVFANQNVQIFGRLEAPSGCVGISTLDLDFLPALTVNESPVNTLAILEQEDVCFEVLVDNSLAIPFVIQWQQLINGVFVDIPGANDVEYCIDKITSEFDKRRYRIQTFATEDPSRTCATVSASAVLDIDGEPKLVCNDLVNVSLDDKCEILITPDMVLEDPGFESRIRIRLTNSQGQEIPNPITVDYIGQLITVHAYDIVNGNSCWSKVFIQDKLPPVITCPKDYTVSCANAGFNPPSPAFEDACDPSATIEKIGDVFLELACDRSDGFIARRTLTYIAKDKHGNVSKPCTFNVFYNSSTLDQIVWPINLSLSCKIAPFFPGWDINKNDYPDITETGIPKVEGFNLATLNPSGEIISISYCLINVTYSDELIQLCGNSYKIVRSWSALNWCNSTLVSHVQLIEVKDNEGPAVTCPTDQNFDIFTQDHACTADFNVPAPIIISDCNATTWTVGYLLADANGMAPGNGSYITDNVVQNGNGYIIKDLPLGRTWLRYTVTDACNNFTYCFTEVTVFDKIKPIPVCDEFTVISLDIFGRARLFATSVDDGSRDNCSEVTFGIRRMNNSCGVPSDAVVAGSFNGNNYYTSVDFCCSDQTSNEQMVELLVIDEAGNKNTCMTTVLIQQKILPVLKCPANVVADCDASLTPQALNSFATFTSACPLYYLDYTDVSTDGKCGEKTIIRTWNVKENGTNKIVVSCVQNVSIRNLTPFNLNSVIFPGDKTLTNQCNQVTDFSPNNPATGGYPKWTNIGCAEVAASYYDQVFEDVDDACYKIIRHWSVLDWCTFDLNLPSTVRKHQQVIKIIDTERPIAKCVPVTLDVITGCSGIVTINGDSDDSCTPTEKMKYSYSLNGNAFVNSRLFSQNLAVGTYQLTWIVEDLCDNKDTCVQTIIVRDVKKPTPYCLTEIGTVLMTTDLKVNIWAKDYNQGATDNCSGILRFTFGANKPLNFANRHYYKNVNGMSAIATEAEYLAGNAELWDPMENSSSLSFDCSDLGLKDLNIYVWDLAGNNDYCSVRVKLQDNSGNCQLTSGIVAEGTISTISESPMANTETYIIDELSHESRVIKSDINGKYIYRQMADNVPYTIYPEKTDDFMNGVSTLDLVIIQRHILGIEPLKDVRLYLAADVNEDGKVTASDLLEIRKLILGVSTTFPKGKSWKFVSPQENETNPWMWPEKVMVKAANNTTFTQNFTGIKLGDVNMNAKTSSLNNRIEIRSAEQILTMQEAILFPNKDNKVSVRAERNNTLSGLQFSLRMPKNVKINTVISGLLDIKPFNFKQIKSNDNHILNISCDYPSAIDIPKEGILFEFVFTVDKEVKLSEVISIDNEIIHGEFIDGDIISYPLHLSVLGQNMMEDQLILYQNIPNPFSENTIVRYYIFEDEMVNIKISDINGKLIYNTQVESKAGNNEIMLNKSIFRHQNGILFLTLSTSKDTGTVKMLMIE